MQPKHLATAQRKNEQRTSKVMWITLVMMVIEIIAGFAFGSMALLADGWHMATHVAAFGIALFAYRYARRHAHNPRFTFGTGKVGVLGGFTSAVVLGVVALVMTIESALRVFEPQTIHFDQALGVAVLGLIVNLVCGVLLSDHHHGHDHGDAHLPDGHEDDDAHGKSHVHHHDHNLQAAYLHVVADALTSVFAIAALLAGKYFGWNWLDPVMGVVGAAVIAHWSYGLVRSTSHILLDGAAGEDIQAAIRQRLGNALERNTDLKVWHIGPQYYAASIIVSPPAAHGEASIPEHYRAVLATVPGLVQVTVEVRAARSEFASAKDPD